MTDVVIGNGRSSVSRSRRSTLLAHCSPADVDPMILARGTPGFSGADLQNMVKCVPVLLPSCAVLCSRAPV